jgi:hypothetical protein
MLRTFQTVVCYLKAKNISRADFESELDATGFPALKYYRDTVFADGGVEVLLEDSNRGKKSLLPNFTRTYLVTSFLMLLHRKLPPEPFRHPLFNPPVDALIQIGVSSILTDQQKSAIQTLKQLFSSCSDVSVSISKRYIVHETPDAKACDYRLGFLVDWKPGMDKRQAQGHWRNQHKALAKQVLPPVVKRYDQILTDMDEADGTIFDDRYQGLALLHVDSYQTYKSLTREPKAWIANMKLVVDEQNFIRSPHFLLLKPVALD